MGSLEEIAAGLRRWTAWHDHWEEEVGSLALDTDDGLVLVDPIDPPAELPSPEHVLVTVYWHGRTAAAIGARHVWASTRSAGPLRNRGIEVTNPFRAGDELPGGIAAFQTARSAEVAYWLPGQRSLAVGDVLLGAGAKPRATSEALRLCPERWLGSKTHDDLRASLQPLLDLQVERVLVSHGEPVLEDGASALAALLR